jgi:hypothetical protein
MRLLNQKIFIIFPISLAMYNEDKLGGMIRNVEFWVKDIFESLQLK